MRYASGTEGSWLTLGSAVSGGLHVVALALVVWGLPVFRSSDDGIVEPPSVEVALITEFSNPPPAPEVNLNTPQHTEVEPEAPEPPNPEPNIAPPAPEPVVQETAKAAPATEQPAPSPQKAVEQTPAVVVEEKVEPVPTPAEEPKHIPETPVVPDPPKPSRLAQVRPRTKPTPPKEPPKPASDFDQLVRNVEQMKPQQAQTSSERPAAPDRTANQRQASAGAPNHNPAQPLSMSEKGHIRAQIVKNWYLDSGAKDLDSLRILLRVELDSDGTVRSVTAAEPGQMGNPVYRAVAESAIRAVRLSSPLDYPKAKYESFKVFELDFRPGDALNRR